MTLKMVVTDMDGTFLSGYNSYNEERFARVFTELKKREIPLVIATGNNMKRLTDLFPNHANQLTFIAENGAQLVHRGEELYSLFMDMTEQEQLLDFLEDSFSDEHLFLSGKDRVYILSSLPVEQKNLLSPFFSRMEVIPHLNQVANQPIYRITIQVEEDFNRKTAMISQRLAGTNLRLVETGFNCFDILPKAVHKAVGLKFLMKEWQISSSEIMVFGDSANDLEMLSLVDQSYAMANATDVVKKVANFMAPANTEDGVLRVLENFLGGK